MNFPPQCSINLPRSTEDIRYSGVAVGSRESGLCRRADRFAIFKPQGHTSESRGRGPRCAAVNGTQKNSPSHTQFIIALGLQVGVGCRVWTHLGTFTLVTPPKTPVTNNITNAGTFIGRHVSICRITSKAGYTATR